MANDDSGVIDSLLVSLGLDVDKKSFRTGMDALSGLKSTALQIGAMAGAVATFDSLTRGVAGTTNELVRLARNTKFSISQIDLLKFALDRVGAGAESAYGIVQKITSLQQDAKEGGLNEITYWGGIFDPEHFRNLTGVDAINYLADSYVQMDSDQKRWIRDGLGEGDNSALVRLLEGGSSGLQDAMKEFVKSYRQPSSELIDSSQEFQEQLALLKLNFDDVSKSISGPLLKSLNELIAASNAFYSSNRSWFDLVFSGGWHNELMKPVEDFSSKIRSRLKRFFADILDVNATVLDAQDMTMRLVWHEDTVSIAVQQLVEDYDLIPRPQGVGMRKHRVIKRKPFGFGRHNNNFGRAPFWYGDGTPPVHYYGSITLVRRNNVVAGKIIINDVDVSDQDVAIIITHPNGSETVRYVVTNDQGCFAIGGLPVPSVIVARVMLVLPTCQTLELESEPLSIS